MEESNSKKVSKVFKLAKNVWSPTSFGIAKNIKSISKHGIVGFEQQKEEQKQEKKLQKELKRNTITGQYLGSHPKVKHTGLAAMVFDENEVRIYAVQGVIKHKQADLLKTFAWDEIIGYEFDANLQVQSDSSQRVTVTRMAALGVFSLAAPKKKTVTRRDLKQVEILHTTTGDLIFEEESHTNSGGGSVGQLSNSMADLNHAQRIAMNTSIKGYVNQNARAQAISNHSDSGISVADELAKLAELKDKGILNKEEFNAEKRKLIG